MMKRSECGCSESVKIIAAHQPTFSFRIRFPQLNKTSATNAAATSAYNNGNAPYGTFAWSQARVLNSWINNGDVASDVCLIALQNDSAGRGVTYYTGWLDRSWNYGSALSQHALGYPGNLGGGNTLQLCAAESFAPTGSGCGSDVLNAGCSMTYGSSGGPWIRDYRSGNHVDSVVHGYDSASCTGTFGKTFNGPRFTSNNILALCNAQGC